MDIKQKWEVKDKGKLRSELCFKHTNRIGGKMEACVLSWRSSLWIGGSVFQKLQVQAVTEFRLRSVSVQHILHKCTNTLLPSVTPSHSSCWVLLFDFSLSSCSSHVLIIFLLCSPRVLIMFSSCFSCSLISVFFRPPKYMHHYAEWLRLGVWMVLWHELDSDPGCIPTWVPEIKLLMNVMDCV